MKRWLSRQSATFVDITDYLRAVQRARQERDQAIARAAAATVAAVELAHTAWAAADQARRDADGARALMATLLEPGETESCRKVRLRSRDEATAFAMRVQTETRCGDLEAYRCPRCPRHPVSLEKFWHIRHADPQHRGRKHRHPARLLRHVPPEHINALRSRFNQHTHPAADVDHTPDDAVKSGGPYPKETTP